MNGPPNTSTSAWASCECRAANWRILCSASLIHAAVLALAAVLVSGGITVVYQPGYLAVGLLLSVWCIAEAASHTTRTCTKNPSTLRFLPASIALALVLSGSTGLFEYASRPVLHQDDPWLSVFFGSALMSAGIILRVLAIRTLGRFFLDSLTLLPEHRRVETGIYAFLQHPSELGTLLIVTGLATTLGSPAASLIGLLLVIPLVLTRMALENTLMKPVPPLPTK